MGLRGSVVSTLGSQPREPGFDSWVEWKNLGGFSNTLRPCPPSSVPGWCSSAGRCHNTGHSSPQQQSLHRQVILHQQAFQQLGEIDTTKRRRGGGGGLGRRRGTQEEPIGWCSSAGRCHNTGHSSPQQQSLHRQVILHQQAFQQLGEIECAVSRRQTEMSVQFCRRKRSRVSQL
ncbi:uncharacterized protein LOC126993112 isoform X3 [Eriocheir sinensis]|uniref:uncharacterized protein LOC126993112 isoform X3 n=1 Tax=Eriocheir sinensis TaxID=95602 RepID=UPI0021CA374C|nr:uncharacterized protein LOC126993112 isoform X3 [Eriocheir sinensis]